MAGSRTEKGRLAGDIGGEKSGERRIERGAGTRILPEHRAIPGAALNESAFLCLAMLSKRKQHPIIYHPLRKQPPSTPETRLRFYARLKAFTGTRNSMDAKRSPAQGLLCLYNL